jgi:hypothetical protein
MENEDYKVIEHMDTIFQVFRDGRIFRVRKSGIKQDALTPHLKAGNKFYLRVQIKGKNTGAHRLLAKAFLGLDIENRTKIIDHLDGNGLNNSFENLRIVSFRDNCRNMKGIKGYWKSGDSYTSRITNNYGIFIQKTFKTIELALEWRRSKELEYGYLTRASDYFILSTPPKESNKITLSTTPKESNKITCYDYIPLTDDIFDWFSNTFKAVNDNVSYVYIKDVFNVFTSSEYYSILNKKEKRETNLKQFYTKIEKCVLLQNNIKLRNSSYAGIRHFKSYIIGFKIPLDDDL